ncbi:PREDICTED: E3 ubiquitin-protein ligase SGR9, amyloplastic [Nelumbo nucifera]|uniref:E3 ubiquitin-protein ligase SGR9, amyloplastic n=1 Tax=Nelumbo nucifera TaxID=4432 RepID=A0A1U7ZJW4_NELNU|nr:PREDICTED: E3 ubiquitin-protein ligase SGR9, amyloplastic [Nelumbo nucifera]
MDELQLQHDSSETIMAALFTLTPCQFSDLRHSLSSDLRRQHHRLCSLLRSTTRFSQTLRHLEALSLHQKTLLIARYFLTTLKQLTRFWEAETPNTSVAVRLRDLDATLLLMLLCEVHQHDKQALERPPAEWRHILNEYVVSNMLAMAGVGVPSGAIVLSPFIDVATRCRRFLDAAGCGGGGGKVEREVATSAAAVVALPSVELCGTGTECAICKEAMGGGRDVCELPCGHMFHWMCILPWLAKRNTCPCCRLRLPTDDVLGEIERLWGVLLRIGRSPRNSCGD